MVEVQAPDRLKPGQHTGMVEVQTPDRLKPGQCAWIIRMMNQELATFQGRLMPAQIPRRLGLQGPHILPRMRTGP